MTVVAQSQEALGAQRWTSAGVLPRRLLSLAVWLIAMGLLAGALVVGLSDARLMIAHPVGLVPAALWIGWPAQRRSIRQLQSVVLLYLSLVVMLAAVPIHMEWPWSGPYGWTLQVSWSVPCLALMVVGRVLLSFCRIDRQSNSIPTEAPMLLAGAVLVLHAAALAGLLQWHYRYGWELDMEVAGQLALCLAMTILLTPLTWILEARVVVAAIFIVVLIWKA